MTELKQEEKSVRPVYVRRHSPSMFGPILLISVGVYFLLQNLGIVSNLNWVAALQLWPLLLVFGGINIIVRQAPRPFGSLLSLIVALLTVAVFGYVLLSSSDTVFSRFGITPSVPELHREPIEYSADVSSADVRIDFGAPGADLYALSDSASVIKGEVTYGNRLNFDASSASSKATIDLATEDAGGFVFNPATWFSWNEAQRWDIGLSPDVSLDLRLGVNSGAVDLDMRGLQVTYLDMNGGSGHAQVVMADGDYDAAFDLGSGSVTMTLPASGRHEIEINSGSGSVTIHLPDSMQLRMEVNRGSGGFNAGGRLNQIDNDEDNPVWETEGYGDSANQLTLVIRQGSGSINVKSGN
ncbi:MAG: DUF4097 family beta strand repeat protein [Ardenticatenales bacterium]|nr:DUF4097 family beta strand repeat protein [Ardenticatenales bacterium]